MKSIFKKILTATLLAVTVSTASAEFRWGPSIGLNAYTFSWKQNLAPTRHLVGGQVGVMGEIMIPGIGFGLDLGLRYNLHGSHVEFGKFPVWSSDGIKNQNVWMHDIEVPLNLKFKWTRMNGFEQTLAPFIFGGPVFNFTAGHNNQPALERPGAYVAMQCGGGVELKERWQISGGYSWGISYEVRTIKLDNYSAVPKGWFFNVAYFLK